MLAYLRTEYNPILESSSKCITPDLKAEGVTVRKKGTHKNALFLRFHVSESSDSQVQSQFVMLKDAGLLRGEAANGGTMYRLSKTGYARLGFRKSSKLCFHLGHREIARLTDYALTENSESKLVVYEVQYEVDLVLEAWMPPDAMKTFRMNRVPEMRKARLVETGDGKFEDVRKLLLRPAAGNIAKATSSKIPPPPSVDEILAKLGTRQLCAFITGFASEKIGLEPTWFLENGRLGLFSEQNCPSESELKVELLNVFWSRRGTPRYEVVFSYDVENVAAWKGTPFEQAVPMLAEALRDYGVGEMAFHPSPFGGFRNSGFSLGDMP